MARLTLSFINADVSSSTQETYRITWHSYEFIHDALLPFDYPKRAFNNSHLRGYLNLTVCWRCGEVERVYSCLQISLEIWAD